MDRPIEVIVVALGEVDVIVSDEDMDRWKMVVELITAGLDNIGERDTPEVKMAPSVIAGIAEGAKMLGVLLTDEEEATRIDDAIDVVSIERTDLSRSV